MSGCDVTASAEGNGEEGRLALACACRAELSAVQIAVADA